MSADLSTTNQAIPRQKYLQIVRAGLEVEKCRFAQEAALKWLAHYPGDLAAGLYYAQALLGEKRYHQALRVLDGLCAADPEYTSAAETMASAQALAEALPFAEREKAERKQKTAWTYTPENGRRTLRFALTGWGEGGLESWGEPLWSARQALQRGDQEEASILIQRALNLSEPNPLTCVTHLRILALNPEVSLREKRELALSYQQRWPNCLAGMLFYAHWSMEDGDADLAVALIHQAAARDVSAQVIRRMWGETHPYRSLWPERLELPFELIIPAQVISYLGWNRLPEGLVNSEASLGPQGEIGTEPPSADRTPEEGLVEGREVASKDYHQETQPVRMSPTRVVDLPPELKYAQVTPQRDPELDAVENELEDLAAALKLPGVARIDGRFPVYVVFSLRKRLEEVYGAKVSALLETEMNSLVQAVQSWRRWGGRLFFADDPAHAEPLGTEPAKSGDPWELKHTLADLDKALAKRGERIGALLIVGGPEVVPFHHLPNPLDDQDVDVASDNPYATCDENYFIPEWPVGRLPGGEGNNARVLLTALRRIRDQHLARGRELVWYRRWWEQLQSLYWKLRQGRKHNFGYAAAIWRRAAAAVFRPIGKANALHVSPPSGIDGSKLENNEAGAGTEEDSENGIPAPLGQLGYFNLHGLVDAPEWFGQRDPLESSSGPDYPVALRPEDIRSPRWQQGAKSVPKIVFSEACYGAHIQGRALDEAISLKFLEAGSLSVVGSTCMSYGSIGSPLIAADLLGSYFWRFTKQGLPSGEALRQAKVQHASEMHLRQGYLDGEDQKTLISFVLYGDPLAQPEPNGRLPQSHRYLDRPLTEVKTMCDRVNCASNTQPIPAEVMASVKKVVSQYLPGMSDAQLGYVQDQQGCAGDCRDCPANSVGVKGEPGNGSSASQQSGEARADTRRLVTLSKQVTLAERIHSQYARLTLDERGKLVKLAVSR